ncbi:MAG: hypothetical protein WBF43_01515, partial [Methylocella sp.]
CCFIVSPHMLQRLATSAGPGLAATAGRTLRLTGNADFAKCAAETGSVARDLLPEDPSIAAKVAKAWADVGVSEEAPSMALLAWPISPAPM